MPGAIGGGGAMAGVAGVATAAGGCTGAALTAPGAGFPHCVQNSAPARSAAPQAQALGSIRFPQFGQNCASAGIFFWQALQIAMAISWKGSDKLPVELVDPLVYFILIDTGEDNYSDDQSKREAKATAAHI